MNYIITVKNKTERHYNVILDNTTEVGSEISWQGQNYLVKEIIITNPDENIIEIKCSNITKTKRKPLITTWS